MEVSVIIPTTDKELKLAEKCADSIKLSSYKDVEIIIINEGKERSEQRNIGISRATGEYILYLDSDQRVSNGLIKECVELMSMGFAGIYIPEIIITPGWFGRLRRFERSFYNGTPVDCVRFFRRVGCPLFDTELNGPEDSDHDRKIKGLKAVSCACIYHDDNVGVIDYFRKKAYYSKSMKRFAEKWPNDKVLNFRWRCFGVFIENGKWRKIIRHPILSLGILFVILTRGVIYYANR